MRLLKIQIHVDRYHALSEIGPFHTTLDWSNRSIHLWFASYGVHISRSGLSPDRCPEWRDE